MKKLAFFIGVFLIMASGMLPPSTDIGSVLMSIGLLLILYASYNKNDPGLF